MKELNLEEQIYLCKYHDVDTSLNVTLGLNEAEAKEYIDKFKKNGLYKQYRNLKDEEYEKLIKRAKKQTKTERILYKYNFNRSKKEYEYFKELLEISSKYQYIEDISLTKIFNIIAAKYQVKYYIVNNNCQRLLESTYLTNRKIFETYEYRVKPTLKEFVRKELNLKNKTVEQKESTSITLENKETEQSSWLEELNKTYIKVPISMLIEWAYQKRLYR